MPSFQVIIAAVTSAAATAALVHSIAKEYVPKELRHYFFLRAKNYVTSQVKSLFESFFLELTLVIEEYDDLNQNLLFKAAELYVEQLIPPDAKRVHVSLPKIANKVSISLGQNREIVDTFNGINLKWKLIKPQVPVVKNSYASPAAFRPRFFELSFQKTHKDVVLGSYLNHVLGISKGIEQKKKILKLFTLKRDGFFGSRADMWQSVNLNHPATFDTLAMDVKLKKRIMEDLDRFLQRKELYKRVGKAWKRGYLLFGPPGTGKSSLIAAMANYLKFDIYDLELTDVRSNSSLRQVLVSTGNKSILVVEDIDCSIELHNRIAEGRAKSAPLGRGLGPEKQEMTLSGLLNFMDGLWSSCGDERIIIFTTNHKEKLDPALLRPGRMDVHIQLSYCDSCIFRQLASNYLGIAEDSLFVEIEELLCNTKVTPAEVGEQLMKAEEAGIALKGLIEVLAMKKREANEGQETESYGSRTTDGGTGEAEDAGRPKRCSRQMEKKMGKIKKSESEIQEGEEDRSEESGIANAGDGVAGAEVAENTQREESGTSGAETGDGI